MTFIIMAGVSCKLKMYSETKTIKTIYNKQLQRKLNCLSTWRPELALRLNE